MNKDPFRYPPVILIGARSYIGRVVASFLESCGYRIVSANSDNCNLLEPSSIRFFYESLDSEKYVVVFVAALTKPQGESYDGFVKNVQMVRNWMEVFNSEKVKSLIYLSSVDVYGRPDTLPITENTPLSPDNWYGLSKRDCEWILHLQAQDQGFPVSILRIPGVYGDGQGDKSVVKSLLDQAKRGSIRIHGSRYVKRDYLYVCDLAGLIKMCIQDPFDDCVNISSGEVLSIKDIVDHICDASGLKFNITYQPSTNRSFDLIYGNDKLRSCFPNFNFTPFIQGLSSYLP